jgi:serine protease Do
MSVRTRDWLKFGALVALAFVFGLAFASTLGLPKKGGAAESILAGQAAAAQTPIPAAKPVADLGNAFVAVAEHVKPAVVYIKSQHVERVETQRLPPGFEELFPQNKRRPQDESGSGFIVSPDGYILTNNHVVAGAQRVTVMLYDKREFPARVIGTDPNTDVAVIKIDARDLPTIAFANSDSTRVGEWALAVGNPLGFDFTVTAGIISAKGRLLNGLPQPTYGIQDFIQTDAAINPGNSGGPLVNIQGRVVGINSAIASETGFYAGYGFAIPINLARTVMEQLVKTGHVERAVLGVSIRPILPEDAAAVNLKEISGVVVNDYSLDDSPAKKAGILPGDVIVALDGQPIDNTPQLQQKVGFKKPGETIEVTVLRQGGEKKILTVRLARAPSEGETAVAAAKAGKTKSDEGSKEDVLGISVQPLSEFGDGDDPRTRAVAHAGGGLVVTDVAPDGPAYQRLFTAEDGGPDIVISVNGHPTHTRTQFREAMSKVKRGDIVTLQVLTRNREATNGWAGRVVRLRAR